MKTITTAILATTLMVTPAVGQEWPMGTAKQGYIPRPILRPELKMVTEIEVDEAIAAVYEQGREDTLDDLTGSTANVWIGDELLYCDIVRVGKLGVEIQC